MDKCYTEIPRISSGELPLLPEEKAATLAGVAKALSDPIRVQMIYLLGQREDLCTCEFEELLGLGQSRVSYHLKVLVQAGIVSWETHGTWSHYGLRDPGILGRVETLTTAAMVRSG